MKTGIKILLALWMSAMCLSCYAAFSAWGDGHTSSVTGVDSYVVANKKKNTGKKKKRKEKNKKNSDVETVVPALTSEEQRRYDYFFLEAVRLKLQRKYDAAFEVLQHCLAINPEAASAQYELAQYYMFLKQIPKGQQALEKAVKNEPDNFWYAQGLANLYLQQNEQDKALDLLENMATRFTDKLDPLYNLMDLYNRREAYDQVIDVLNRLEERLSLIHI